MKHNRQIKAVLLVLLISISIISCKKAVSPKPLPPAPKQEEAKIQPEVPASQIIPNYEIIKKSNQYRKDGGTTYFILIHPLGLTPDIHTAQIKNLVKKIVKSEEKKGNVTIEIFSSLNALDWVVNKKDLSAPLLKTRYIAKFVGISEGETYKNTLYLYPSSTKDTIEYDPAKE